MKCSDPEYRQEEATYIQNKCSDPQYRQKEARYIQDKCCDMDYKILEYTQHKEASVKRHFGCSLEQSVKIFHSKIAKGCIFVCSSCHQTNFEDYVIPVHNLHTTVYRELLEKCLSGYASVNDVEYICLPCKKQFIMVRYQSFH